MAAQSYSQGINQQNGVRLFRYSDWLPRYPSPKLEKLKIYETRCVNGRHGKNISNMIISWHRFVCYYLWNALAKFYENPWNLHTLLIRSKSTHSTRNQTRDFRSKRFVNNSRRPRRLCRLLKPQANGVTGPPGVNYNGLEFRGKSVALQSRFLYFDRQDDRKAILAMGKVAKCKGNSRGKKRNTSTETTERQSIESTENIRAALISEMRSLG